MPDLYRQKDVATMITETPKQLPEYLSMPCYACEKEISTHLCRFRIGELVVQICLCPVCMQMDTVRLLECTIGIQDIGNPRLPTFLP